MPPERSLVANRYQIISQLGEGNMGTVYRATDRLTGQIVALKQVRTGTADNQTQSANDYESVSDPLMSLANEFRTLASLRHPHVINVLDYGFHSDQDQTPTPYFTMPLLHEPQGLLEATSNQPLKKQIALVVQMLQALAYLHRRGIIHRDLKPANILVENEHVYLLDFGLAAHQEQTARETVGTLAYMAPEVLQSAPATEASDLYAVGVILAEMLGGQHPLRIDNITDLIQDILFAEPDLAHLDIGEALQNTIKRLMARNPKERYQRVDEVIHDLCAATGLDIPEETVSIRESYLQAAKFVGRETEIKLLTNALEDILATKVNAPVRGSAWLIGGESGVGKSRLIDELRIQALVKGVLVLRGQAVTEGGLPYQLWRAIIRRLILIVPLANHEAAVLKQVLPDIDVLLDQPVKASRARGVRTAHERLILIVEYLLREATKQQPVLLILEDLQWAQDSESLQLMLPLLSRLQNMRLMLIGSYRNDEAPELPRQMPEMRLIQLDRLHESEISKLSASMLGKVGERKDIVTLLHQESEGNVFFLIEVVRALAENAGRLSNIGRTTLPNTVFAGGMQQIVNRRLGRLPKWARPPLNIAAIAGRQIAPAVIQHCFPQLNFEEWLTVCINTAVFSVEDTLLRFAHDKLREGVLEQLNAGDVALLSQRVAEALETLYSDELEEYATVLNQHWRAAGNREKEAHYGLIAATQANAKYQFKEAFALLRRLQDIKAHQLTDDPDRTLANIEYQLGIANYGISDYDQVRVHQKKALKLYQKVSDEMGIAEAMTALGEADFRQGKNETARPLIEASLKHYKALDEQSRVGTAYMNLGVIEAQFGDTIKARDYFQMSYDILKEVGEPLMVARALNNLGISYDMLGDNEKARKYYQESLEIRQRIKDRKGIAYSLFNLSALDRNEGNVERARRNITEALTTMREIGERMSTAIALNELANLEAEEGNVDLGRQYLKESLQLRQEIGDKGGINLTLIGFGNLERDAGNLEAAWGYYHEALRVAHEAKLETRLLGTLQEIAHLLAKAGSLAGAVALLSVVIRENQTHHIPTDKLREKLSTYRAQLSADATARALNRAEKMTIEDAVKMALAGNNADAAR
jgi:tetratricopeptide (TPR) repeat protein